jgi:succinate dehydrogenase / fumarate reductase iron-sulfur subunit
VFDHDCREGICGTCSLMIDGQAHGPQRGTATCQLHMRKFKSGDTIVIEPWRATAFPIIKDLMVDRAPFDRIVESGGFITADRRCARREPDPDPEAGGRRVDGRGRLHRLRCLRGGVPQRRGQPVHGRQGRHLNLLPQGQPERYKRVEAMVETMDEYFGSCTNHGECEAACPKEISIDFIALMHRTTARPSSRTASPSLAADRPTHRDER